MNNTRFILHGGFTPHQKQENDTFFLEVLNTAPQKVNILLVYFATEIDKVDRYQKDDIEQFEKNKGSKVLMFQVANEADFALQLQDSDIIYFRGGRTNKILEILKKFLELKSLLEGKIVASDSAGTNALCTVFYSSSIGVGDGLGIVPIKVICHCTGENRDKLLEVRPDLETVCMPEYQFTVFVY